MGQTHFGITKGFGPCNLFPLLINSPPLLEINPPQNVFLLIGVFGVVVFLLFQQCEGSRRIWMKWIEL